MLVVLWTMLLLSCSDRRNMLFCYWREHFLWILISFHSTTIKHIASLMTNCLRLGVFWQHIAICTCPGFFTLPQAFASVSLRAPVLGWTGFCFHTTGDRSWASVFWYNLSSCPLERCWLYEKWPEDLIRVLYVWYFWIFHKLLWLTWKWIGEENVILLLSDINVVLLSRWF